jgi:hypothetical protein
MLNPQEAQTNLAKIAKRVALQMTADFSNRSAALNYRNLTGIPLPTVDISRTIDEKKLKFGTAMLGKGNLEADPAFRFVMRVLFFAPRFMLGNLDAIRQISPTHFDAFEYERNPKGSVWTIPVVNKKVYLPRGWVWNKDLSRMALARVLRMALTGLATSMLVNWIINRLFSRDKFKFNWQYKSFKNLTLGEKAYRMFQINTAAVAKWLHQAPPETEEQWVNPFRQYADIFKWIIDPVRTGFMKTAVFSIPSLIFYIAGYNPAFNKRYLTGKEMLASGSPKINLPLIGEVNIGNVGRFASSRTTDIGTPQGTFVERFVPTAMNLLSNAFVPISVTQFLQTLAGSSSFFEGAMAVLGENVPKPRRETGDHYELKQFQQFRRRDIRLKAKRGKTAKTWPARKGSRSVFFGD